MIRDDIRAVVIGRNIFCIGEANSLSGGFDALTRVVTKIVKSERNGQMAPVAWIEIWAGDLLWIEIDAAQCQGIEYFAPKPRDLDASPTGADALAMAMAPINISEISFVDQPSEIFGDRSFAMDVCTTPPELDCNDPACPVHGVPI